MEWPCRGSCHRQTRGAVERGYGRGERTRTEPPGRMGRVGIVVGNRDRPGGLGFKSNLVIVLFCFAGDSFQDFRMLQSAIL
jgi:hypothetical protein